MSFSDHVTGIIAGVASGFSLSPVLGLSIYLARPLQFRWRGASMHAATNDREVGNVSLGHGSDRSNAVHTL
ncbi:MAG TPA: hypothetical protein VH370_26430, partial [Humisphaera sp.]|nr:hypothetical protein [Humisphaera sp.]